MSINQFLLDTGATFSVLTEAPGLLSSSSTTVMGLSDEPNIIMSVILYVATGTLVLFSHEFLIMAESPSTLLGMDILNKVQASFFMNMEPALFNGTDCKF